MTWHWRLSTNASFAKAGLFLLLSCLSACDAGGAEETPSASKSGTLTFGSWMAQEHARVASQPDQRADATKFRPLDEQILATLLCDLPGSVVGIHDLRNAGLELGPGNLGYVQPPIRSALQAALQATSDSDCPHPAKNLRLYFDLRTIAQQQFWGRVLESDPDALVAAPASSWHLAGVAIDAWEPEEWSCVLTRAGLQPLSDPEIRRRDPNHFEMRTDETRDLRQASVKAFQRLHNANQSSGGTTLEEDGLYGPATEAALMQAPVEGFAALPPSCPSLNASSTSGAPLQAPFLSTPEP